MHNAQCTYMKTKKSFQGNNQCSLHVNTCWAWVSALILTHGSYLLSSKCPNLQFPAERQCGWSHAGVVFCILDHHQKTNVLHDWIRSWIQCSKTCLGLVISFALSGFSWSRDTVGSIFSGWSLLLSNAGWDHARWFLKWVVLLMYWSWVLHTLQTVWVLSILHSTSWNSNCCHTEVSKKSYRLGDRQCSHFVATWT